MSYSPAQLIKIATNYEQLSIESLVVTAKKKRREKVIQRQRSVIEALFVFRLNKPRIKKNHFPINDEGQARNALARVQQLSSAPWYKGSLKDFQSFSVS